MIKHPDIEEIFITHEQIVNKCQELGAIISSDYVGKVPILVGLLKGCVPFMSELIKHITTYMQIDFMDVSSYAGTQTTGKVHILKDLSEDITGRDVIIVDDIIDTGLTLHEVKEILQKRGAKSIEVVTLIDKPEGRKINTVVPKYIGYNIPKKFVVGFGLDYNELYRNLPYIGILKESVYK
ncbi:MAG TPA: hypoxanthine phosphoribosyltransferase [Bacilli bacterium]|nr:hypoxanthine phosphoribosyltransferase [Bacilli bacterium]